MASILRQIVAGPRARHPEAGLDLCYVTDHIIATSGPSETYPQLAYRNPLDQLVKFLDSKHGEDWAIWEFRAEGTGYPDESVYGRVRHYPWPDHHPPPFRLVPMIMASMRNWLHGGELGGGVVTGDGRPMSSGKDAVTEAQRKEKRDKRVVVVHCKAGKGRSGTVSCSYLIAEEGWKPEDALARFTERRMRPRFGAGVSIPSQLRWISYVERWTKGGKKYTDRPIEIPEIHVWGLRNGVKVDIEGFADEGKKIDVFHTFKKEERVVVDPKAPEESGISDMIWEMAGYSVTKQKEKAPDEAHFSEATNPGETPSSTAEEKEHIGKAKTIKRKGTEMLHKVSPAGSHKGVERTKNDSATSSKTDVTEANSDEEPGGMAVILRPKAPIRIPNSDVNISVERRNKTPKSMGLTMVTAVAHVWFNTFFEGQGPR
ncbi:Telomerase protein component 1 [Fusarium oxysporum]|nr:Telomerase protein component 1 [Fusarium oxysporum]